MQNVEIRQLDLSSRFTAHLLRAQYTTAAEVLLTPVHQLAQKTNLSQIDVEQLVFDVSQAVLSREEAQCSSVAALAGTDRNRSIKGGKVSFGDPQIDLLFDGGVRIGSLTEIAGQSASGKTHLCLQLALNVQLSVAQGGLDGGALFISSEGTVSSTRLLQMAAHMPASETSSDRNSERNAWDYLDNIHTEKAPDVDTLETVVSYHVPAAIERINELAKKNQIDPELVSLTGFGGDEPPASQYLAEHRNTPPIPPLPVRLVILDSIAAPVRATHENVSSGFVERSKELVSIGDKLKRIAHIYNCAVVVVNQVQDVFERTGPLPPHLVETPSAQVDSPTSPTSARDQTPTSPAFSSILPPSSRFLTTPAALSRTSSTSSSYSRYSTSSTSEPLPPPHIQYSVPLLLYTRFQALHSTGASIIPPNPHSSKVSAALGTTWTNLVNTRVLCMIGRRGDSVKREMNVVFGPELKRGKVEYELREEGVRSLGPVEWREELWVEHDEEEGEEERSNGRDGNDGMEVDEADHATPDGNRDQEDAEEDELEEEMAWSDGSEKESPRQEQESGIT
ncbi:uncharacterized protein JCM6883_000154 [Sporobolomyces salmoneus]|uniref:uncharacterized protein n=1 Tax=Sporobolomyces salmoneus TaxID=183962 RepID=UPI00317F8961